MQGLSEAHKVGEQKIYWTEKKARGEAENRQHSRVTGETRPCHRRSSPARWKYAYCPSRPLQVLCDMEVGSEESRQYNA